MTVRTQILPTIGDLRKAAQDFSNLTEKEADGMNRRELMCFLKEQLIEMRREPENFKALDNLLKTSYTYS